MRIFNTRNEMMKALCPPGSVILEVGVFKGEFAEVLYQTQPRRLILCDPWDCRMVSGDADGNNVVEADLPAEFRKIYDKFAGDGRTTLVRGRSPGSLNFLPARSIDVLYIDGDHSYAGCRTDLLMGLRLVKPGGWICGHDYEINPAKTPHRYDFGVGRAVDTFCAEKGLKISAKAMDGCVSYAIQLPYDDPSEGEASRPSSSESETSPLCR